MSDKIIIKNQSQFDSLPSRVENETIIKVIGKLNKIDRQIEGARVEICENAYIEKIYGSAIIDNVYGSAKIENVYGSAKINYVYGSAKINYVYGSAKIDNVFWSAKINYYASISPLPKIEQNAQILKIEKTYHNPSNNKYYWDKEMMVPVLY